MNKLVINEGFLTHLEALQMHIKDNVAGMFGGNRKSKSHGSSCEFDDYRDYVAGDDITHDLISCTLSSILTSARCTTVYTLTRAAQ